MRMHALQLLGLSAISVWHAASDPRCQVKGFYQSTPFVFSCDGSGGDRDTNKAKVRLQGSDAGFQELIRIPKGTLDFVLSVDGDFAVDIEVLNPHGSENVVPEKLQDVGSGEFLGSYKGMDIRYVGHSSTLPTSEQLSFSGAATPELVVRLKSHAATSQDFTLGFYYFPYSGDGPQCKQGGAPVGCKAFPQAATRRAVVDWVTWLRTKYSDPESAWKELLSSLGKQGSPLNSLPFHRWCDVWERHSSSTSCEASYKFLTGGGLEANIPHIYKQQFLWAWNLPELASFDATCCGQLRSSFGGPDEAWTSIQKVLVQYNLDAPVKGLLQVCKGSVKAPDSQEYSSFLDADGDRPSGDIVASDLAHCWQQHQQQAPPAPSPTPLPTPSASLPAPTPPPEDESKPAPTAAPTPAPTPAPTQMPAPQPETNMRVPTVFHYKRQSGTRCSGVPFTHHPSIGCDGWSGITPQQCQEKCATSEKAPNCPRLPCMAGNYYPGSKWCHLFTTDQCLDTLPDASSNAFVKAPGGGAMHPIDQPEMVTHPYPDQSTAVANPAAVANSKAHYLQKKHVPFMIAGAAGGAAAGAAVMAGLGLIIGSVQAPPANAGAKPPSGNPLLNAIKHGANQPPKPSMKAGLKLPSLSAKETKKPSKPVKIAMDASTTATVALPVGATVLPITSQAGFVVGRLIVIDAGTAVEEANFVVGMGSIILRTPLQHLHAAGATIGQPVPGTPLSALPALATTSIPPVAARAPFFASSHGLEAKSNGPMLPLACLFFVCLCGLLALVIAAIVDPCHRPRKKVTRSTDVGGSVASVGTASTCSNSEGDYYDQYSDYGNSVAMAGGSLASTGGGSEYYDYGHLAQDSTASTAYAYGFPTGA